MLSNRLGTVNAFDRGLKSVFRYSKHHTFKPTLDEKESYIDVIWILQVVG